MAQVARLLIVADSIARGRLCRVQRSGRLTLERQGEAGAQVRLRFAMDTLVLLHTCPHPLSPASDYPRQPLQLTLDAQRAPLPEIW
jgi:uncharacterized protein YcgI (DUF1989 family)